MADEIRVRRDDATVGTTPAAVPRAPLDTARQLPPDAGAVPPSGSAAAVPEYDDPEDARRDIEATRARMSETLNEIEGALVRKKEQIQNRLDFLAPVRENPWPAMGGALAAGILLGLLTGGDDDEDDEVDDDEDVDGSEYRAPRRSSRADYGWHRRTEVLEDRTRRLLAIARDQEEEIRRLRGKKKKKRADDDSLVRRAARWADEERDEWSGKGSRLDDDEGSRLDGLWRSMEDGLTRFLTDAVRDLLRRR
jgi:ElaB/YqjD/DUF883 family membrane-anchored ribosome-binding protein